MDNVRPYLIRRSDGFVETIDGLIAVTMRVATGARANNILFFTFSPGVGKESITVEWNKDDQLSVFPGVVANVLLGRRYAFQPSDAAVIWANDRFAADAPEPAPISPATAEDRDATGQDSGDVDKPVSGADNGAADAPVIDSAPDLNAMIAAQALVATIAAPWGATPSPDTPPASDPAPATKQKKNDPASSSPPKEETPTN